MSNNREDRVYAKTVHVLMGIQRMSNHGKKKCIRQVIKDDSKEHFDLKMLEARLKVFGGEWRIHKTVNKRNVEFARKFLIKELIDYPDNASFADSIFRTGLMQRDAKVTKKWMLDIDTQDEEYINIIQIMLKNVTVFNKIESPKGWHYITEQFDTRDICELEYITLLRDGYHYVKTVKEDE